jgi:hypothetical protein
LQQRKGSAWHHAGGVFDLDDPFAVRLEIALRGEAEVGFGTEQGACDQPNSQAPGRAGAHHPIRHGAARKQ